MIIRATGLWGQVQNNASPEHNRAIILINSQPLCLFAQDLHTIKPASTLVPMGEGTLEVPS